MSFERQVERWGPLAVAVASAVAWWYRGASIPNSITKELLGALLSAGAICAGFLTTALTILLPMGASKLGERLRQQQMMGDVIGYLRAAIFSWLGVVTVSMYIFFSLEGEQPVISRIYATALVGLAVHAAMAMGRILHILMNLFERMSEPEDLQG